MNHKNLKISVLLFLLASCSTGNLQMLSTDSQSVLVEEHRTDDWSQANANGVTIGDKSLDKLFILGNDASVRGDVQAAISYFEQLLEKVPTSIFVKKKLAVEYIKVNNTERALVMLKEVYGVEGSKDALSGLLLAGVYTATGDFNSAQKVYEEVLAAHPGNEQACLFLAKNYASSNQNSRAFKVLRQCEKISPKNAAFANFKGKIYLESNNIAKAKTSFKRALKIDPYYFQAVGSLGAIEEEAGKPEKALEIYEKFLAKNPESYPILMRVTQIYFNQNDNEKVLPYLERLVNLDPSNLNLKLRLGVIYSDLKDYDNSIGVFKEILAVMPDSDKVLYYLGSLHQVTFRLDEAINYFSKINENSSLFGDGNIQIANIMQVMALKEWTDTKGQVGEQTEKFLSHVNQKGLTEKNHVEMQVILAGFFESTEQYDKAVLTLQGVEEKEDFNNQYRYYFANILDRVGMKDKAISVVEIIVREEPQNAHALNFLGYSLIEKGEQMNRAYTLIKKAVELMPEDGYIRDSLGWYYFKVGNYEQARIHIEKARELAGNDHVIIKHLAKTYKALNMYDKAVVYFNMAIANADPVDRSELLKQLEEVQGKKRLPASVKED